jgi:hypothetical protein
MDQHNVDRRFQPPQCVQYGKLPFRTAQYYLPGDIADRILDQLRHPVRIGRRNRHQYLANTRQSGKLPQRMPE